MMMLVMLVWVERRIFLKTNKDVGVRSMNCHGKRNQEIYKVKVLYFSSAFPRIEITILIYRNIHDPLSLSTTLTNSLTHSSPFGLFWKPNENGEKLQMNENNGEVERATWKTFFVKKSFYFLFFFLFFISKHSIYVCMCLLDRFHNFCHLLMNDILHLQVNFYLKLKSSFCSIYFALSISFRLDDRSLSESSLRQHISRLQEMIN